MRPAHQSLPKTKAPPNHGTPHTVTHPRVLPCLHCRSERGTTLMMTHGLVGNPSCMHLWALRVVTCPGRSILQSPKHWQMNTRHTHTPRLSARFPYLKSRCTSRAYCSHVFIRFISSAAAGGVSLLCKTQGQLGITRRYEQLGGGCEVFVHYFLM